MPQTARPIFFGLFYILFLLLILEAALRIQQSVGPLYDLTFQDFIEHSHVSQTLNHIPTSQDSYNEKGIQITGLDSPKIPAGENPLKILFMGDSFMQGYPPQATIPEFFRQSAERQSFKKTLTLWNAGYSSYAPLIYIVQAKKLVPSFHPDLIILTLDESDLIDDYALYKPWVQRDSFGKIIAVKPSAPNEIKLEGYKSLQKIPLHSVRLLAMWVLKVRLYFIFENYRREYKGKYYAHKLSDSSRRFSFNLVHSFDESPSAVQKYSPEAKSFNDAIDELFTVLAELMGDPKKVLIVYHPHIHHLVPDSRGFLWRQWVPSIAGKQAERHGVLFYDTSTDLKKKFGEHPENFYVKNDMHFNEEGLKIYADLIRLKIIPEILNTEEKRLPV